MMALLSWQCGPSADGCCAIESCREEAELDCYRAPALPCSMQANYGMLLMGPYWLHGHDCSKTLVAVEFTWLSCVWPAGEGCAPSPPPLIFQRKDSGCTEITHKACLCCYCTTLVSLTPAIAKDCNRIAKLSKDTTISPGKSCRSRHKCGWMHSLCQHTPNQGRILCLWGHKGPLRTQDTASGGQALSVTA
jgi:hypothetical protein